MAKNQRNKSTENGSMLNVFLVEKVKEMASDLPIEGHQLNLFGTDLLTQLDPRDPLLALAARLPWEVFEQTFIKHYAKGVGRPAKPIRLMVGLLLLKQLENLSDEQVV